MQLTRPSTTCFLCALAVILAGLGMAGQGVCQPVGTSFVGGTSITGVEQGRALSLGHLATERIRAYANLSIDSLEGSLRTFPFGQRLPDRDQAIVVDGSLQITVNGVPQREGVHFLVDYQRKQITFFREMDPQALIHVSFRWLDPQEVQQFGYGGISGVVGAAEDQRAAAAVNADPVLGQGALFTAGDVQVNLRQLVQAGSSDKPGTQAAPSIEARQLSLALGEVKPDQPGTSVRMDWAVSETLRPAEDPERQRLARLAALTGADRSARSASDDEQSSARDPFKGVARTLALSHRSGPLQLEAQVQEIDRDFAAPQLGYDANKRGYRTEEINTALALSSKGDSRLTFNRRAISGKEEDVDGRMVLQEGALKLGSFEYRRNELEISEDFAPDQNLAKALVGEYGFKARQQLTSKLGLEKALPGQVRGIKDVQEHWGWAPSKSLQLTRDSRKITAGEGASLTEYRQVAQLLEGKVEITQTGFEMSHDFGLAAQMGYENRAAHQGHRFQDLTVQVRPIDGLALTHGRSKVYVNPSGEEQQGNLTEKTQNALEWQVTPSTKLNLSQFTQTAGSEVARQAKDRSQITTTKQRAVALEHQLTDDTKVKLADVLTRSQQGDQETSERQQLWGVDTKLGIAQVSLGQDRRRRQDGARWVASNYSLAMGPLKAAYAEVAETDQARKTLLNLQFEKPLSSKLSLSARYLQVKNWKEHEKAPEYKSLEGTEAALTYKPSDNLSLTAWRKDRDIGEDARYVDQGIRWDLKMASIVGFSGQLNRVERDGKGHTGGSQLALTLAPSERVSLEAGYSETYDPEGVVRPSHYYKAALKPWSGCELSGHYTARDQGAEKGPTTKGYSIAQQWGTGGELKISYLMNPLNDKGQIVPRTEESYSLTLPKEWLGDRLALKGAYSMVDDRAKGKGATVASGELAWAPSARDSLQLTYAQGYNYQQDIAGGFGSLKYDVRYSRQLGEGQQLNLSGQYVSYVGDSVKGSKGRHDDYRVEADFRLVF